MKDLKIRARRGFTLIELVVVIAILGILAGIAIPRFLDATATARGAKIVADLRTIDSAIVIYNAKTGTYPTGTADLITNAPAAATPQYQLLASWPVPATGNCIFPAQPATTVSVAADATYILATDGTNANSRAACVDAGNTADKLAAGGAGWGN